MGGREGGRCVPSFDPRLLSIVLQISWASQGAQQTVWPREGETLPRQWCSLRISPLADAFRLDSPAAGPTAAFITLHEPRAQSPLPAESKGWGMNVCGFVPVS